ncbi:MAG: DMT family transporter [Burkholderiales bacterium]|nr:DMT family transporter [Burkholderiales bacterium]
MSVDQHTLPRSTWLLLAALTLGWGFNWPMMKIALTEMPVWTFRGVCVAAGAVGMFMIAWRGGLRVAPPAGSWPRLALTALFNVTLWNVLIAQGLTYLPAGRSVILAYTMPLWTVLLSRMVLGETLTTRRMIGLGLGMAGMLVLIGNELTLLRSAPIGALCVVTAAFAWAMGTVLMKRFPTALPTTSFTGWQMLFGGLPIVIGALLLDSQRWQPISWPVAGAVLYNVFVAFIFCHWAWFKIVGRASAGVSALGTLLIPIVGVFSSMLVLDERPAWPEYLSMLLVFGAIATVLIPRRAAA